MAKIKSKALKRGKQTSRSLSKLTSAAGNLSGKNGIKGYASLIKNNSGFKNSKTGKELSKISARGNMLKGGVTGGIKGYKELIKQLEDINKQAEKVVQRTMKDFGTRAPAWVSKAVRETYGISAADMKLSLKRVASGKEAGGKIKISGIPVDNIALIYEGRLLTPTHFKLKPKSRPANMKPYQVSAEIFKGQRKTLGSDVFMAGAGGGVQIPFQRTSKDPYPIKAVKTLSVPQMVNNEKVSEEINKAINEGLKKRLDHYMDQAMK